MNSIRGIIFDMDGVLIDAREWHYEALNQALEIFGFSISKDSHLNEFDGLPTKDKLNTLSVRSCLPTSLHPLINSLKQHYTLQIAKLYCKPNDTHKYALSRLVKKGFKLAVASNSIRDSIEMMLGRAELLPWLQFTLSNEDVIRGKPSPEIYITAITRLGLAPAECVIVEDNPHGVKAAIEAGAHVLQVSDPSDVTLERIEDFITYCEKLNSSHSQNISYS